MRSLHLLFLLALVAAAAAQADLRVEPSPLELHEINQTGIVHVYQDGQPVKNFSTLRFIAPKHAYSMYKARALPDQPGAVQITPVPGRAEDGSFTLLIAAGGEQTTLDVLMDLPVPDNAGVTIYLDKVDTLHLPIADRYPLGARIDPAFEAVPGRSYEWWIDGELAEKGMEKSAIDLLADALGRHTVVLKEFEGERLTAEGSAAYQVVHESDLVVPTQVGRPLRLQGASAQTGPFTRFEWFMDGRLLHAGPEFRYTARTRGDHRIVLRASEPNDDAYPFAFREIQWVIRAE